MTEAPVLSVFTSQWRAVRRRTGTVDREAFQWLLATLGIVASLLGVMEFLWPATGRAVGPWWVVVMLLVGILVGIAYRLLKRSVRAVSSAGSWTIEITSGNVLDYRPCVLTTDRRRSHLLEQVAPTSLVSQLLDSVSVSTQAELRGLLSSAVERRLAKPGDVLFIEPDRGTGAVILLACGRPTDHGTVTTWSHLSRTYDGLWSAIRSRHIDEVSVPVIGAGFSRVNLSHRAVLLALLLSFHAANTERLVCRRLRIVIPPGEIDQDGLVRARRFLSALGYSVR
jgi:hypothetical protein